jgi:ribose-phosphate pyrophosphokinase
VTAILPYLAYSRQDKPTRFMREPTTARLMADLSIVAGASRFVTWHPHSAQTQGFYDHVPVDRLEALSLFVDEFERFKGRQDVIVVAPDAGASKFITSFARALHLNSAIASKFRPRPEKAVISEIIGDFSGKRVAVVLDDMISSGGTVYELIKQLVEEKGIQEIYLGASHNLCMEVARQRLLDLYANYRLREVVVTNSIPQTDAFQALPFLSVRDIAEVFTLVINRIHFNRPVSDLYYRSQEAGSEK